MNESTNELGNSPKINQFGGYYENGKAYSACRIAECIDCYHSFAINNGRPPTVKEFMVEARIGGKDLACKIINKIKYNIDIPSLSTGHRREGVMSIIDPNMEIQLFMYSLYLEWPSRPIRSYKMRVSEKYNISLSDGTISEWFTRNDRFKGVFVSKKCTFSVLKYNSVNMEYYAEYKQYFSSIYHNNVLFTDEKSFIINDLLKLRQRRDPLTGIVPDFIHPVGINMRKRYNIFCTIRPF